MISKFADRARFYERGCQEKASPTAGRRDKFVVAPAHCVARILLLAVGEDFDVSSQYCCFQETEKRIGGDELPTIVLFEPRGLMLFQVVRGGIES